MMNPAGESTGGALRLDFDRRIMLQFCGSVVTSDAGLLPYRELDDVLGLTVVAGNSLADARTGKNGRHALVGLLRQSVFSRLAGYEDVNDAERLRHDPAMRWMVGGKAAQGSAASPSQIGRFETQWLATDKNLLALPIFQDNGLTGFMHGVRHEASCSTWIRASVRLTANKRIASGTATIPAPATIHSSCSTSSVTWNDVRFVPATSTAPTDGTVC